MRNSIVDDETLATWVKASNSARRKQGEQRAAQRSSYVIGTARVEHSGLTRSSILDIETTAARDRQHTDLAVNVVRNSAELYDFLIAKVDESLQRNESDHLDNTFLLRTHKIALSGITPDAGIYRTGTVTRREYS